MTKYLTQPLLRMPLDHYQRTDHHQINCSNELLLKSRQATDYVFKQNYFIKKILLKRRMWIKFLGLKFVNWLLIKCFFSHQISSCLFQREIDSCGVVIVALKDVDRVSIKQNCLRVNHIILSNSLKHTLVTWMYVTSYHPILISISLNSDRACRMRQNVIYCVFFISRVSISLTYLPILSAWWH
jgi:hypothetical protein